MATLRQFERGVARTLRAMERDAQQRERLRAADAAREAVDAYAEFIRLLVEAHKVGFQRRIWPRVDTPPEAEPERESLHESAASERRDAYRPGPFSRWIGFAARRRRQLDIDVDAAIAADEQHHLRACEAVRARNAAAARAAAVAALEPAAVMEVINGVSDAGAFPIALRGLSIEFGGEWLRAEVDGLDADDLPAQSVTLLQSGKASFKALTKAKLHELHRDTECALAARMAIEILKALPIETIEVVVHCKLLERGSGMLVRQPIVRLKTTAQALGAINLDRAEPSFLVEHLGGRFAWSRRDGFAAAPG